MPDCLKVACCTNVLGNITSDFCVATVGDFSKKDLDDCKKFCLDNSCSSGNLSNKSSDNSSGNSSNNSSDIFLLLKKKKHR